MCTTLTWQVVRNLRSAAARAAADKTAAGCSPSSEAVGLTGRTGCWVCCVGCLLWLPGQLPPASLPLLPPSALPRAMALEQMGCQNRMDVIPCTDLGLIWTLGRRFFGDLPNSGTFVNS